MNRLNAKASGGLLFLLLVMGALLFLPAWTLDYWQAWAALFLLVGMPLALGSWWGLFVYILFMPALLWRIFDEEKFLAKNLRGYSEYLSKVPYRLVPYLW